METALRPHLPDYWKDSNISAMKKENGWNLSFNVSAYYNALKDFNGPANIGKTICCPYPLWTTPREIWESELQKKHTYEEIFLYENVQV